MSVRVCLFGTGQASAHHVGVLRAVDPTVEISVASRAPATAEAFQRAHGLRRAYGSYPAGAEGDDDVAVVATPPANHAELTRALLPTGKHLLIEKPAVAGLDELRALLPDLRAARATVMVGENQHFAPQAARLVELLRREAFGRPILVHVHRTIRSPLRTWRADPDEMRLGALHEGGIHWIRRLLQLTEVFAADPDTDVARVAAFSPGTRTTATPGDETAVVVAEHESGALSQLTHSWGVAHRTGLLDPSKVVCEGGAVYFDVRGRGGLVFRGDRGRPAALLPPVRRDRNGYQAMWSAFLAAVRTGAPAPLGLDVVFRDFAYLDAAYRSLASGGREVPTRMPR